MVFMEESSEENLSCVLTAKEHLDKPDAFWKQVLWADEVEIEL